VKAIEIVGLCGVPIDVFGVMMPILWILTLPARNMDPLFSCVSAQDSMCVAVGRGSWDSSGVLVWGGDQGLR